MPFLELEYVAGGSLDQQLDGTPWPTTRAARLAEQVALGIAEAHRQGIVHRDLKPSNVLLAADGTPKVGDFGLAKMLDSKTGLTRTESVMGSPSYMAPEQAQGRAKEAGAAVDIYAMGAILYELLTGRPPFRGTTALETLEQVKSDRAGRALAPGAGPAARHRDDLSQVLHKEPGRRYATADALTDDLRRFLEGRPIEARRVARGTSLALVSAQSSCCGMTAIAFVAIVIWPSERRMMAFVFRAAARSDPEGRSRDTRKPVRIPDAQARATRLARQVGQRFDSLNALAKAASIGRDLQFPAKRFDLLAHQAIASLALPDMKASGHVIERAPLAALVAFHEDMTRYAFRFRDGWIHVKNIVDDQEVGRFQALGNLEIPVFTLSPDGRYLAANDHPSLDVKIWDIERRAIVAIDRGSQSGVTAEFSPDSQRIVVIRDDGAFLIYDLRTGKPLKTWRTQVGSHGLAFRPDGCKLQSLTAAPKRLSAASSMPNRVT